MKATITICGSLSIALFMALAPVYGQSAANDWEMPRTIDGHPDLQGVWANNTITPVERPEVFGDKEFLTDEDVAYFERRVVEIQQEGGDALFGEGVLEAVFTGEVNSYDPSTGNYDSQWMVTRTVHRRTSQIIDPPNGRYPPRTERAIADARARAEYREEHPADSWLDRPLGERCVSFGAPRLGSGYNSYSQIVQTKDHVVIYQEMAHDARIIPLYDKPQLDEDIRLWHGDSRGWWEDDTLVIETTNYSDESSPGVETSRKVNIERITRISDEALRYLFTSHDPGTFTAPYTREIILDASDGEIYEYACHEGNYGMENILRGHREEERRAAAAAATSGEQ